MSFKSSCNPYTTSKIPDNKRGFSLTTFSNFNKFSRDKEMKMKLETLNEKTQNISDKNLSNEDSYLKTNENEINNNLNMTKNGNNKLDSNRKCYNILNTKEGSYSGKKDSIKKENNFENTNNDKMWNKPLSNTQMPIISGKMNMNCTKTKIENNQNNYNFSAVFDDKVKKKIIEKDIEKKLESYKIKLNSIMLKILKEEKQKEEERELLYYKTNSEGEKRRLESLIALERVQSSERIIRLNEYFNMKIYLNKNFLYFIIK